MSLRIWRNTNGGDRSCTISHIRSEARDACKRHEPLLGGDWEFTTAEQTAGRQKTSRPYTLGGDWRCTPRAVRNYCRRRLLCASSDNLSVACPRQKYRG